MGHREVSGLVGALSLLTRWPLRAHVDGDHLARAVPWFPVVGAAIGAVIAVVFVAFARFLPALIAGALSAAGGAILTGAFHEDGLGDVADAFGGAFSSERRLEILQDPRLGVFGVLAVSAAFLIRSEAIATLDAWSAIALLPVAHSLSRVSMVVLMRRLPLSGPGGLGAGYAASLTRVGETASIVRGGVIAAGLVGVWSLPLFLLCGLAAFVMGVLTRVKIGGLTGDVLGATQQVTELAILLMGAVVLHEGWGNLAWWAS